MKLHRKIKYNPKVCRAHDLGTTPKVEVAIRSKVKIVSQHNNSKTTESNVTELHRKIEHNKKVCHAQKLGSYAQGQGHNQVRGHIASKIVLLINY